MSNSDNLNLAFELHKNGKIEDAEKYYNLALKDNNKDYRIYDFLGKIYIQKKDYKKAIEHLQKGLELEANDENLWFDIGLAYKGNKDYGKAKCSYKKATELNPKLSEAYINLAFLHYNDNEPYDAVKSYTKALEQLPNDIDIMYFLSLAYMKIKDYKKGLEFFESRLCRASAVLTQEKTYPKLACTDKIWQGEDISDKTIYTYYEAGFGDVIMFARYLPLLQKISKKVIFKPQAELADWFQQNFPDIEVLKYFKNPDEMKFDVHIPMLSIPYILKLEEDKVFTGHAGYMKANSEKVKIFKQKYFNNNKFKIGIKWQGNTYYEQERVIKIQNFFNLMEIPNTQFYSCQTFEGSEEFKKIPKEYDVIDMSNAFSDFSDTAAAVKNMDLVICNDTSLAHVAGAIGKPCWVVLPHVYNWRWHVDLSKCDWYDSVKIFRQDVQGDWDGVFKEIGNELRKVL